MKTNITWLVTSGRGGNDGTWWQKPNINRCSPSGWNMSTPIEWSCNWFHALDLNAPTFPTFLETYIPNVSWVRVSHWPMLDNVNGPFVQFQTWKQIHFKLKLWFLSLVSSGKNKDTSVSKYLAPIYLLCHLLVWKHRQIPDSTGRCCLYSSMIKVCCLHSGWTVILKLLRWHIQKTLGSPLAICFSSGIMQQVQWIRISSWCSQRKHANPRQKKNTSQTNATIASVYRAPKICY